MIHQHNHPLMALITVERPTVPEIALESVTETALSNEIYIAVRGADIIFPYSRGGIHHPQSLHHSPSHNYHHYTNDVHQHLVSILKLLRPEDKLRMAVRLESQFSSKRIRYLLVVTNGTDESCILGVDYEGEGATIGLVMAIWNDIQIKLDGDGGFGVTSGTTRHHIFKPVSVQAMWSAFQALHVAKRKSIQRNYFDGGTSHHWLQFYLDRIKSKHSLLHEWNTVNSESDDTQTCNTLYDHVNKSNDQVNFEELITQRLKSIMMSLDLEQVTSKEIRCKLESHFQHDLSDYKLYIDKEMIRIMGQMEQASKILDYLYLGSEWNASNLEELKCKGVKKILNVTCEIDNFFPGCFDYLNIRVHDDEFTDILRHLSATFYYIQKAKDEGSKVLVHCKKGISRSASVVIAYIMKEKNCDLNEAIEYVKKNRSIIRPNPEFLKQLEIYQGMLQSKNDVSSWRSESDLKDIVAASKRKPKNRGSFRLDDKENHPMKMTHQRRSSWPPKITSSDDKNRLIQQHQKSSKVKERIEDFEKFKQHSLANLKSEEEAKASDISSANNQRIGLVSKLADQYESNRSAELPSEERNLSCDNMFEITKITADDEYHRDNCSSLEEPEPEPLQTCHQAAAAEEECSEDSSRTSSVSNLDLIYLQNQMKFVKRRTEELNSRSSAPANNNNNNNQKLSPQQQQQQQQSSAAAQRKKTYGSTHPLKFLKNSNHNV